MASSVGHPKIFDDTISMFLGDEDIGLDTPSPALVVGSDRRPLPLQDSQLMRHSLNHKKLYVDRDHAVAKYQEAMQSNSVKHVKDEMLNILRDRARGEPFGGYRQLSPTEKYDLKKRITTAQLFLRDLDRERTLFGNIVVTSMPPGEAQGATVLPWNRHHHGFEMQLKDVSAIGKMCVAEEEKLRWLFAIVLYPCSCGKVHLQEIERVVNDPDRIPAGRLLYGILDERMSCGLVLEPKTPEAPSLVIPRIVIVDVDEARDLERGTGNLSIGEPLTRCPSKK